MTQTRAAITTMLAAIGLAVLAIPAIAQEPARETAELSFCVEHADAAMPHDDMEAWMAEMDVEMHDHMHDMMVMMQRDGAAHGMDEGSVPGPRSMGRPGSMDTGTMMGGASMNGSMMMGGGS